MLSKLLDSIRATLLGDKEGFLERRAVIRLPKRHIVICVRGDFRFTGTMVDIGLGGMRVEVAGVGVLKVGNEVVVGRQSPHREEGDVKCEVRWMRPGIGHTLVGLRFADSKENMARSWIKAFLRDAGFTNTFFRQRRQFMRVPCHVLCCARLESGEIIMKATMLDVSMMGATVLGPVVIAKGVHFTLDIGPHRTLAALKQVKGRVVACHDDVTTQQTAHRIQFVDLTPAQTKLLRAYMRLLQREISK